MKPSVLENFFEIIGMANGYFSKVLAISKNKLI
jgi:hypothetical protein